MIVDYPGCEKCPLKDCPPVRGKGPAGGIMVLGEAPGATEVQRKEPFVGQSGQLLRSTLKAAGVDPSSVYYTNSCLCRPPQNKTPSTTAVKCCSQRLRDEILGVDPQKILCVGGTGLSALRGEPTPITKWRGIGIMTPSEKPIYVISTYHPAAVLRTTDLFRDFAKDIVKLVSNETPLPQPSLTTIVPTTPEEAIEYLRELREASILSTDLETTGFSPLKDTIESFGFGAWSGETSGVSVIIPYEVGCQPSVREEMRDLISTFEGPLVFHNLKFDLQFYQIFFGTDVRPQSPRDTMLMQYAVDERGSGGDTSGGSSGNSRGYRVHGLKDQARIRYDVPDYHFDFKEFYSKPREERNYQLLYEYQGIDCFITLRLYRDLCNDIEEESPALWELLDEILIPGALAFTEIELGGVPVDLPYFRALEIEMTLQIDDLRRKLVESAKSLELPEDLNFGSPTQALKWVKALGFKVESTEKEELQFAIQRQGKVPQDRVDLLKDFLLYRQLDRTKGTYVTGLLERVDVDECIRPDFLLHGADTGRLACRDPNLQNIPILMGPKIRNGYIAPEGYTLLEADGSQLELRVVCWYSQDEVMMAAYQNNEDLHKLVASKMFKVPISQVTKLERYMAKYVDFGIIYGRGAYSLANGWEMEYIVQQGGKAWTVKEAEYFLREFLDSFPGLKAWIETQHRLVRARKFVETPTGRRRRFPLMMEENVYSVERQAVNTPVQSLASDLVLTALIRLHRIFKDKYPTTDPWRPAVRILFTVHDSIMFLVRDDLLDEVRPMIHYEMEQNLPIQMNVPIRADTKIGCRWGDMEEEK